MVECVGPWAQTKAWLACKNVPDMPILVKKKIGMDLAILVHLLSMGRKILLLKLPSDISLWIFGKAITKKKLYN